jgi:methyltransferase
MIVDHLGPPQIAAACVLLQRGLEELHSQRNTRWLKQQGGREAGGEFYPVVAVAHLSWIAALACLAPPSAAVHWTLLIAFLALQILRYWIIGTLGRYWTHRIITLPQAPLVIKGPYRFLHHPNYAVSIAETLLLPLVFGQPAMGVIFTVLWGVVLRFKIFLEDEALAARRAAALAPW